MEVRVNRREFAFRERESRIEFHRVVEKGDRLGVADTGTGVHANAVGFQRVERPGRCLVNRYAESLD